ncbi:MAG TPA: beta-ketoacyl-[acyl-carrier-protein] synthase family protein [Jatrophihabitans sp.]|uniref:beta-ketoacyl-[acyl-carrier-protein] synthase family protein n=1 Tax=Jatrophihabitans sp. TaxID=1932789 RepID=UPI002F1FB00C
MTRRVVVTGIGVVAPGAVGREKYWGNLTAGRTSTRGLTLCDPAPFRSKVAAEVDFDPLAAGLSEEQAHNLDRASQFALTAAREALDDAQLGDSYDPRRMGVSLGSAVGATTALERVYRQMSNEGQLWTVKSDAPPALYDYFVPSSFVAEIAALANAQGPGALISTGCTSGIDSVGNAAELIHDGRADIMITGASDAPISPITVACFDTIKATSTYNDTPESASRPFDATRGGFVLGEGAAVLILEELESARRRHAPIYAEIKGYGSRCNGYHMTGLRPDGAELASAVTTALDEGRVNAVDIDYVNAHGSGTKQNDRHETAALKRSLGEHAYRVPISSIKSMIGHSLGAIGSLEIAACALAIRDNVVPPTANLHNNDPELDLDYVPLTARSQRVDTVLTTGSGFGGFQSAMVLQALGGRG